MKRIEKHSRSERFFSEMSWKLRRGVGLVVLPVALATTAHAAPIVTFDADTVTSVVSMNNDFLFSESAATLDSVSSPGYTGQPVYGGFEEAGVGSFWSANNRANAGLKLRWNGGAGMEGESSSGLYLFSQADFLSGLDTGLVLMDAANDTVSGEAGFINAGDGPGNPAVSSSTIRLVIKDDSGYHISGPQPLVSNTPFSFEATTLSYSGFTPTVNTTTEAGTIGGASVPTFSGITWVGFRIDAVRGSKVVQGVNIGVELFAVQAATAPTVTVVDGGLRHQTIEGFGASGAFYINRLITNSNSGELADLLFRDLGLDIFRIRNVYDQGGYVGDVNDMLTTIQLGETALGRPIKVLMSSWSPPGYLKNTGSSSGTNNATLASDGGGYRYTDFAAWWADSLDYYSSVGIDADYISVQNEPNWHPDYDGCGFEPTETIDFAGYNNAFEAVWQELAFRYGTAAMPKMLGPETISFNRLDEYIDNLITPSNAYAYVHHYYQNDVGLNPDVLNSLMVDTKQTYGYKPLFQTEYCVLNGNTNSPLDRKLNLARLMYNALTLEEVSAYFYWALYWNGEQGLVNIPDTTSYIITPEYYAFKHYSAFIDADWTRLDASSAESGVDLSAYISPGEDKVTVVIINQNTASVSYDITFENLGITTGEIYRTSASLDCAGIGGFDPAAAISLPAESITTLSLDAAVVPTNTAPVFSSNPVVEADAVEDAAYSSTIADDASDADNNPLSFSAIAGPSWLNMASDGMLSGTPSNADVGLNSWLMQVSDGIAAPVQATLEITVANVNDAPVFTADPINKADADESVAYSATISGSAVDVDAGDTLTYSKTSGPAWLNVAANGALTGTPGAVDAGANVFTIKVEDAALASDTATLNITVIAAPVNQAPTFTADPFSKANGMEGAAYSASIAGDASDPESDPLTFSKVSGPSWLSVASDGALSGTPGAGDVGLNAFTVQVDALGGNDTAVLNITVDAASGGAVDDAANGDIIGSGTVAGSYVDTQASDNGYESITEIESGGKPSIRHSLLDHRWTVNVTGGNSVIFYVEAYKTANSEGDDFVFAYSADNVNFTDMVTVAKTADDNAVQSFTLPNTLSGTVYIRVVDTDRSQGNKGLDTVYIDAMYIRSDGAPPPNQAPAFSSDPVVEVNAVEDTGYSSSIADNASDPEGDPMTFSKVAGPAWLSVAANGALSGTPGAGDVGLNAFTVQVDATGGSATATLQITVDAAGTITDIYVSDIAMSSAAYGGNRVSGVAAITIRDDSGAAVSGANVSVNWSGATSSSASAATDGSGVVVFESDRKKNGGTFTVTVTGVSAAGYNYNPALNVETSDSITTP